MKYAPKKVFILENNEYTEITYEELCHREATDKKLWNNHSEKG